MITIEPPSTIPIPGLSKSGLARFLTRVRLILELGEVEVLLSDDACLRQLNKSFRGKNKATDVLSFPSPPEIFAAHAGDLAISLETANRQAAALDHSLGDEVRILLLHGLLHLSGLDHESDNGQMAEQEAKLRRELRLPATLIERTLARRQASVLSLKLTKPPAKRRSTAQVAPKTGNRQDKQERQGGR